MGTIELFLVGWAFGVFTCTFVVCYDLKESRKRIREYFKKRKRQHARYISKYHKG